MKSVLFVCTANICRSPMAMGFLRAKVQSDTTDWRIGSAGVWASEGYPAATYSLRVMEDAGINISDHRSSQITKEMIWEFNLVLVMEKGHKEALKFEFPEYASKIYLLSEMIGSYSNIEDPMGSSIVDFIDTAREIEQIINQGFERINQLAEGE